MESSKFAEIEEKVLERVSNSRGLWSDLEALCALGGRFAGTESEAQARLLLSRRLEEACGVNVVAHPIDYAGWSRGEEASLEILASSQPRLPCVPLVRSPAPPPEGLTAEVLDMGRGGERDFARLAEKLPGRIALVRHEYMFASDTVHRRRKYQWALQGGAVGFLIGSPWPGNLPVTGSCGAEPGGGIPAAGLSAETVERITGSGPQPRVKLRMELTEAPARTANLLAELPGRGQGWVVLCAHLDGHHLSQSAMDNGTGVAAALCVAEALAPHMDRMERGLRVMFFSVEEWALTGSRIYVDGLDAAQRSAIGLVINLDAVAGSSQLTALTSDFAKAEQFLLQSAHAMGSELGVHRPLMANSDHFNFARQGIPAARIVAGFNEPTSNLKYVLTPGDTLDKVSPGDLRAAARLIAGLTLRACAAPELALRESD
ncbi:MAG: M28 family peptidase [SAR324 cluster bacterium]|nr:M28 family peptidase [SAR324 cluster bacterium]